MTEMPSEKQNVSASILNDKFIYIFGGYNKQKYFNNIEKYDIQNDIWKSIK